MFNLKNKEKLGTLGLTQCWFYAERVDGRRTIVGLIDLFCQPPVEYMRVGQQCCFYIKNRDYVKLLKSTVRGWELETLSPEASMPFLALEQVVRGNKMIRATF